MILWQCQGHQTSASCPGMLRKFGAKKSIAISIDRSGLFQIEPHSHDIAQTKEPETPMVKHLRALIQVLVISQRPHQ